MCSVLKRALAASNRWSSLLCPVQRIATSYRDQHDATSRTALYELHVRNGGKMVVFADHWLPLQYKQQSIGESHKHVRQQVGLFDVGHMLQTRIEGKDSAELIESLCVADCRSMKAGTGSLSVLTNSSGGIIDDLIVSRVDDQCFYIVSNAGCAHKVRPLFERQVQHFQSQGRHVFLHFLNETHSLIALQGPKAAAALQPLVSSIDLTKLYFMQSCQASFNDTNSIRVTRCGYTGEDGFELSVPNRCAESFVHQLMDSSNASVQLAGLGARDSLRLEAGLCLYGNDIDEQTTPIEAGLAWTIAKRRRQPTDATFPGANHILAQLNKQTPVQRKRVGLKGITNGPPARQGAVIKSTVDDSSTSSIGQVTSGCPSPILKQNIAIAYVANDSAKIGTKVNVLIRNRSYEYEVVKMPFVPTNYYMPPKK